MTRTAYQSYQTQQVMTASPAQLVAMLYDRAIASINEAIRAIEAGDVERRWRANKRAVDIITHLADTLDTERGGEIADNLLRLYNFALQRLFEVDVRNDPQPAREVVEVLEPLRQSWQQLAGRPAGADGAAVSSSRPASPGRSAPHVAVTS